MVDEVKSETTVAAPVGPAIKPWDGVLFNVTKGIHAGQTRPAIVLRTFPGTGAPPDGIDLATEAGRDWIRSEEGVAWNRSAAGQAYQKAHPGVHLLVFGVEPQYAEVHHAMPNQYRRL